MAKFKVTPAQKSSLGAKLHTGVEKILPYAMGPLLFIGITFSSRLVSVIMAGFFLLLTLGKHGLPLLRERLSLSTLAVWLYTAVCLLSGLWCHYRQLSVVESAKFLTAFSLFGIVLFYVKKEQIRLLLGSLSGAIAAVGVFCLDASGTQCLFKLLQFVSSAFHFTLTAERAGYESGIRITGIFHNANVSGGLLAFGLLISLYLFQTAVTKKEKLLVSLALGIQALTFFLSFSMGAMASFAVACLVYVICAGKEKRFPTFLLMLECVAVTVLCSFGCFSFLGGGMTGGLILLALAVANGGLIYALDTWVGQRISAALTGHSCLIGVSSGSLVAFAVVFVLLAFRMTGSTVLVPGETLDRAINPDAGSYTITVDGIDPTVRIYTQNEADLMMHTETTLYRGLLSEAVFEVPEDSKVVWFQLSGDGELHAVTLSDGTQLPLHYKLLPGFAANRLQALWANQNFIQRLVFFRDGIDLWLLSPIIGWGIGGVEGHVTTVQEFFYESKYVHNHFIQMLAEAGIIGFATYLLLLGSALWLLIRGRKKGSPLLPMLAACLTMMSMHAMTELVWSTLPVLTTVFLVFAVMTLEFHEPESCAVLKKIPKAEFLAAGLMWVLMLAFGLLMLGNQLAPLQREMLSNNADRYSSSGIISTMKKIDAMDVYENIDDKTNLMGMALQTGNFTEAASYARQLRKCNEFDTAYYVSAYYYLPLRDIPSIFEVMQVGLIQERSNPDAWNSAFNLFAQMAKQLEPTYLPDLIDGIIQTGDLMNEVNAGLMAPVTLNDKQQVLLDAARALDDVDADGAYAGLQSILNR